MSACAVHPLAPTRSSPEILVPWRISSLSELSERLADSFDQPLLIPTTQYLEPHTRVLVEIKFPRKKGRDSTQLHGRVLWSRRARPRHRIAACMCVLVDAEEQHRWAYLIARAAGTWDGSQKRRSRRIATSLSIEIRDADRQFSGVVKDLSAGGAFILADRTPAIDAEVILSKSAPGAAMPIQLTGRVVWITHASSSQGFGVCFTGRDSGRAPVVRELLRRVDQQLT
jgi:Tfp pilus assembly protein PilZ